MSNAAMTNHGSLSNIRSTKRGVSRRIVVRKAALPSVKLREEAKLTKNPTTPLLLSRNYGKNAINSFKRESREVSQSALRVCTRIFVGAKVAKGKLRNFVVANKMRLRERRHDLILAAFSLVKRLITFPFSQATFQLKGMELVGDILSDIWDYNSALVYYFKGVSFCRKIIEIICRSS
eukprot:TRINITY_DN24267_c0_g2_i1.p1 TRINITY_DN24267_c0_g2~~TRINITY_DN24267_c0_g2_i1.p1  ORF type:complete len:178 (-),score=15.96 TRINITY_DN24267_c0_g2_i1:1016-1549(-)